MQIKHMVHGGKVSETKQVERNGIPVGIVKGYIATWDIDRGDWTGIKDQFMPGAFAESIERHKKTGRQIRFKDHHGKTIGGFPIDKVREDSTGLYGEGEINLDVQQGREAFALAKQGVLSDFSIGWGNATFTTNDDIRQITKSEVWEGSIVDEPMNPFANVTEVKAAVPFQNLPLEDRKRPWDAGQAIARIRAFTDSDGFPSADYKNAFLWYDADAPDEFDSYKLPIADVVFDTMVVVPRGVFTAASILAGARGGVDIPDADRAAVEANVDRYYEKMGLQSPFSEKGFRLDDFDSVDERTLESLLKTGVSFSNEKAKKIVAAIKSSGLRDEELEQRDAESLKGIDESLDRIINRNREGK